MKRLALVLIAPIFASLVILGLSRGPAPAQAEIIPTSATPTPRPVSYLPTPYRGPPPPQQQINICAMPPEYRHGGDETLALTNFTMDLPPGDYFVGTITRGSTTTVEVCYLPDSSVLRLIDTSGGEISRTARSGDAHFAFDSIVASVRPPFDVTKGVRMPTLTTIDP
jgi:hypothetical protein